MQDTKSLEILGENETSKSEIREVLNLLKWPSNGTVLRISMFGFLVKLSVSVLVLPGCALGFVCFVGGGWLV